MQAPSIRNTTTPPVRSALLLEKSPRRTRARRRAICKRRPRRRVNRGRDGGWNPLAFGRRLDQGAKLRRKAKEKAPRFRGALGGGEDKSLSPFLTEKRADNAEKCGSNQRSAYLFISIKNQKYPTDSEYKADGEGHP